MIRVIKKIFNRKIMTLALSQFGQVSIIDFLAFSVLGILIIALIVLVRKYKEKTTDNINVAAGIGLAFYISIVIQLTLACRESGSRIGIDLDLFHGLRGADNDFHWLMLAYVILNCLMFVPYGILLSMLSIIRRQTPGRRLLLVVLISFNSSMLIECTQLITQRGFYEVQDLAFNTLGGLLGGVLFELGVRAAHGIVRAAERI